MISRKKLTCIGTLMLALLVIALPLWAADTAGKKADGKVNINKATEKELIEKLTWSDGPEYAKKAAAAIVAWREKKGPFKHINDLGLIDVIDGATFLEIRNQIKVED